MLSNEKLFTSRGDASLGRTVGGEKTSRRLWSEETAYTQEISKKGKKIKRKSGEGKNRGGP